MKRGVFSSIMATDKFGIGFKIERLSKNSKTRPRDWDRLDQENENIRKLGKIFKFSLFFRTKTQ